MGPTLILASVGVRELVFAKNEFADRERERERAEQIPEGFPKTI